MLKSKKNEPWTLSAEDRLEQSQAARYDLEAEVAELKGVLAEKTEYAECLEEILDLQDDWLNGAESDLRWQALSLAAHRSPENAAPEFVRGKAEVFYEFLASGEKTNFLRGDAAGEPPPSAASAPPEVDLKPGTMVDPSQPPPIGFGSWMEYLRSEWLQSPGRLPWHPGVLQEMLEKDPRYEQPEDNVVPMPKPAILTKAQSYLDSFRVDGDGTIAFYQSPEEPDDVGRMEVKLSLDFCAELGSPKSITVAVEPGDTLNAPDAKVMSFPDRSGEN